ncbi:chitinase 6 isoform X2 [Lycorma delicatula]|uniref:chitinase 6 isoform X2 n=1 Tax=Lycorma delicatula TaxID=130591 RepID=UPI003F5173E2
MCEHGSPPDDKLHSNTTENMQTLRHHPQLSCNRKTLYNNYRFGSTEMKLHWCNKCCNSFQQLIIIFIILVSLINVSQCTKIIETDVDVSLRRIRRDSSDEKRVVCYYTNWSVYRPGTAKFSPQNINPYLCTHLIYAFGGLDKDNGLRPFDKYQDIEQGGYAKFTGLKTYNKGLKTMLAIGGWNEGSTRFSPLVADEDRRKEFVRNVIKFLRQNHFDGLDLDWEYPAFRDGGKSRDRENYAQLVQELREEFDRESNKTGRTRLLLTMAVPAGIEYIDKGYDIPKLNRYLDFMNILSYDYHSAFEPAVNHHSPLYSLEEDNEYNFDAQLSIDYTVKHYLELGADRNKLVLGIPTYGRSYTLFNPESNQLGAPADGPGEQGDATREKGYLAYYEICGSVKSNKDWQVEHPKRSAMGPYAYKGNQWVGYDDEDIVKEKSRYVNDKNLGGIMFWSIDNDDFRGTCHNRPYPLIEAGKEALFGSSGGSNRKSSNAISSSTNEVKTARPLPVTPLQRRPSKPTKLKSTLHRSSSTTQRIATSAATTSHQNVANSLTTPEPPTTPDPGSDFVCKDEGFFPHPRDCKKYFWCLDSGPSNLGIVAHQFTCPSGLFFNKAADSCDFARNVLCKEKKEPKTTTTAASFTTTPTTTTSNPRLKFTAATAKSTGIRYTTTTTTTTTTPPPPVEEVVEEEDDYDHAEEDPQAIKQLIMLIKKLGGVAELEKQLENAGAGGGYSDVTPPSTISRNLYNRVLTPGPSTTPPPEEIPSDEGHSRIKYKPLNRNKPVVEEVDEGVEDEEDIVQGRENVKPRYKVIERKRPDRQQQPSQDDEEDHENVNVRPKYTNIQRSRPTTTTSSDSSSYSPRTTTSRYVTLYRQRPVDETQALEDTSSSSSSSPYFRKTEDEQNSKTIQTNINNGEDNDDDDANDGDERSTIKTVNKVSGGEFLTTTSTTATTSTTTTSTLLTTDLNPPLTTTITITTKTKTVNKNDQLDITTTIPITKYTSTESDRSSFKTSEVVTTQAPSSTVPYQTSTSTSIVTMVVEGATERQKVPLSQLEKVLADHKVVSDHIDIYPFHSSDISSNYNYNDNNYNSLPISNKINSSNINKYENTNRRRKPVFKDNDKETTTKFTPSYLNRRRNNKILKETTTTKLTDENLFIENQDQVVTSRRFIPSRSRNKFSSFTTESSIEEYDKKSTTESNSLNNFEARRQRPPVNRFASSGRGRTTTADYFDLSSTTSYTPTIRSRSRFISSRDRTTTSVFPTTERKRIGRFRNKNVLSSTVSTPYDIATLSSTTEIPLADEISKNDDVFRHSRQRKPLEEKKISNLIGIHNSSSNNNNERFRNVSLENNETKNSSDETAEILISMENTNKLIQSHNSTNNVTDFKFNPDEKSESNDKSYINVQKENKKIDSVIVSTTNINFLADQLQSSQEETINVAKEMNDASLVNNDNDIKNNSSTHLNSTRRRKIIKVRLGRNGTVHENEIENTTAIPLQFLTVQFTDSDDVKESRSGGRGGSRFFDESIDTSQTTALPSHESTINNYRFLIRKNKKSRQNQDGIIIKDDEKIINNLIKESFRRINNNTDNINQGIKIKKRRKLVRVNNSTSNDSGSNSIQQTVIKRGSKKFNNTEDDNLAFISATTNVNNNILQQPTNKTSGVNVRRRIVIRNKNKTVHDNLTGETNINIDQTKNVTNLIVNSDNNNRSVRRRILIRQRKNDDVSTKTNDIRKIKSRRVNSGDYELKRKSVSDDLEIGHSEYDSKDIKKTHLIDGNRVNQRGSIRAKDFLNDKFQNGITNNDDNDSGGEKLNESSRKIIRNDKIVKENLSTLNQEENDNYKEVNRARVAVRRPVRVNHRQNNVNTQNEGVTIQLSNTDSASTTARTQGKFLRRRVNKFRAENNRNNDNGIIYDNGTLTSTSSSIQPQGTPLDRTTLPSSAVTTLRPRKFEFPKRTGRPSTNLQQPLVKTTSGNTEENSSGTDSQIVESKEELAMTEDSGSSTLPDLANVAVAAIQSLATLPPQPVETTTFLPIVTSRRTSTLPAITVLSTTAAAEKVTPVVYSSRGTLRPFVKKRITQQPTTSVKVSTPRPSYITKTKTSSSTSGRGTYDPSVDYESDYYAAEPVDVPLSGKVRIHNDGYIECLDIGNFPHPFSCKKFISCAKMENGHLLGWEYTCPRGLSFDPIGGICNWSAGLGCKE